MAVRKIDGNALRGGAGISAVVLLVAFALDLALVVPVVLVALAIGALFGLKASPLGAAFRALKAGFRLNVPVKPEDEPPPRFAQTLGAVVLGGASVAFLADAATFGWVLVLLVAGLQSLLAITGICIGCEMYLLGKRVKARGASA